MDVLNALSKTNKGRIDYDRTWFEDGKLQEVLAGCCTSPTVIPLNSRDSQPTTPKNTPNDSGLNDSQQENTTSFDKSLERKHSFVLQKLTPVDTMIQDLEHSFVEQTKDSVEKRKSLYEGHTRMLLQQAENQLMELYLKREREAMHVLNEACKQEELRKQEVEKKKLKWKEHHSQHAKHMDARMKEAMRQKREEEQKQLQREQESRDRLKYVQQREAEITKQAQALGHALSTCKHAKHLPSSVHNSSAIFAQICDKLRRIIEEINQSEATEGHVKMVDDLTANAKQVYDFVTKHLAEANKKGEEENAAVEKQKKEQKEKQEKEKAAAVAAAAKAKVLSQDNADEMYTSSLALLDKTRVSYEPLLDPSQKKYKFDLQKAVNTPINAISRVSGSHLRDKLNKLRHLLSRQPVELAAGNKRVSIATHPAASPFCQDLLAKKIVNQGNEQVASNHESAFPIAAVAVGLWSEFPDFGQLLLAHFYNRCPYLVPFYLPKKDNQSSEDYYRALGYTYENGEVEKQDKFLKRMSGLMRLYASLMISPIPQHMSRGGYGAGAQQQHANHPFPVQQSWIWLVRVINQQPRPDVTATLIYDVISVTGIALFRLYSKQFVKLLQLLYQEYLPKIKAVNGAGGPVTRLEAFLERVIKTSNVAEPKGMLDQGFWMS